MSIAIVALTLTPIASLSTLAELFGSGSRATSPNGSGPPVATSTMVVGGIVTMLARSVSPPTESRALSTAMPLESLIWNSIVGWTGPVDDGVADGVAVAPSVGRDTTNHTTSTPASSARTTPLATSERERDICAEARSSSSAARRRAARPPSE